MVYGRNVRVNLKQILRDTVEYKTECKLKKV